MIENDLVVLRPISLEDTENILKWRNSENVKKYFCMQSDLKKEEHVWWLENKVKTGKVVQFIIQEKKNHRDIGTVYIRDIDYAYKNGEFGIYIGEESSRGCGYGQAAMELICHYAFQTLKLHKIFLRVLETNKTAIALYEKCGFQKEGLFKEHIYTPIHGYCNLVFMGRINDYE